MRKTIKSSIDSKRAFTLVELIVVLVVLAILAAMVVPALTGYFRKAKKAQYIQKADEARVAAQAVMQELYGLDDGNAAHNSTTDGNNVFWNSGTDKKWGDKVLQLLGCGRGAANGEPYIFIIGVGTHNSAGGMSLTQRYTVYYVAYVENENSPALFYVNGEWMYEYPRYDGSPAIDTRSFGTTSFRNTIVLNGAKIPLQFYIISNRTGLNASSATFWTGSDSRSLYSHSDGYYGKS
ncbi:MAG: prepilin-type N-terminal cleavage/methylation domain-containing protein [Clostridiales bacterium]|nr:prepilin-type N-terminal cleavage/methylation domain-containing protein [Clostridiales bacterium]